MDTTLRLIVSQLLMIATVFSFVVSLYCFYTGTRLDKENSGEYNFRIVTTYTLLAIWFVLVSMFLYNVTILVYPK